MPECQVLGPVQVRHDGETVDIGGPKPRTLIALLAARAGEAVSTDSLIDSLWGEAAPDTASNTLQSYVSRLRKAIGTDAIESTGSGYRLSVSPDTVDALKFESLARQAHALLEQDAARASDLLREGLDLWRGRPFEDTVDEGQLRPEVTRLEELRLVAIEDRNDAELMLGRHGPLVGEIEALLQDHPWRERLWAQLMTAQYRGERQGEALRTYQRARRVLGEGLGIEPSVELQRLEEQILLQDPDLGDTQTAEPDIRNPFKGLHAFKEGDAQDFYGRRRLTAQLLETLGGESRFLAVIGPSGSGKSSVVRAGLIPALRKGALPTSDQWLIAHMLPGAHPFAEFEAALLRAAFDPPDSLSEQLANGDLGILTAALRVLPHDEAPLLLLIDQFEELFSLVENESVRQRFLANLMIAASDPRGRIRIVVTMRADFFDRPLLYPEFGELLRSSMVTVMPMSADELRSAVTEPATAVGVTIEPALLTELITDVVTQPGALPLFQYTLTELFARRSDGTLDVDEYRRIGGINGALVGRAEDLYSGMTSAQQEAAGQLFLRLVTVSDHTEDTRRRVRAGELIDLDLDPVVMQEVIEAFGKHRLLTFDRETATGAPTVEVAHEALLREWPRLREWIAKSRSDLRTHAGYVAAVKEWIAAGKDADYLLAGARLVRFERWNAGTALKLTGREREFLDAGIARRYGEAAAERDRRAGEESLRRRARSRLWAAVAAVIVLLAVGGLILLNTLGSDGPRVAVFFSGREDPIGRIIGAGLDNAADSFTIQPEEFVALTNPVADFATLVASKPDLIFTGIVFADEAAMRIAAENPDPTYVYFDVPPDQALGVEKHVEITFAEEDGSFLVGAAAALNSQTSIIGFIGGVQVDLIEGFRAGYEAGARAINPDIEILAAYLAPSLDRADVGFDRPDLGKAVAERLIEQGADVIYPAAGFSGFGALEAIAEQSILQGRHLWYIGVDGDEWLIWSSRPDLRPHILTSMVKRFDQAIFNVTRDFVDGSLELRPQRLGLVEGGVDYAKSGDFLDDFETQLDDLKARVISGEIEVPRIPTGPLLPLLALPAHEPLPADADLLEAFLLRATGGDIDGALALADPEMAWRFGDGLREGLESEAVAGVQINDLACEPTAQGAQCVVAYESFLTRRLGYVAEWVLEVRIVDGLILEIINYTTTADTDSFELFEWVSVNYSDDMQDCVAAECIRLMMAHLDEWITATGP